MDNNIGGVMVSVLASSAVDHGFGSRFNEYKIGMFCFSSNYKCNRNYSAILGTLQITSYVDSRNSS
jgi:hypothetical protein